MMDFETVREYLKSVLLPKVKQEVRDIVEEWLNALKPEDDSDRLGVCIAIDLRGKAISVEQYVKLLALLPRSYLSPRAAFVSALRSCPEAVKMCCTAPVLDGEVVYASTLDLRAFLECYAMPSGYPVTLDDLEEAAHMFFFPYGWASLEEITPSWVGPEGIVWVQPLSEIEQMKREEGDDQLASVLHDALGLGESWDTPLLYVRYPPNAPLTRCVQPIALDAGWHKYGGCFLSASERDGWGRTHSRSGTRLPLRERIHESIAHLSRDFTAHLLGTPSLRPRSDEAIRREALRRFEHAQEDHPSDSGSS